MAPSWIPQNIQKRVFKYVLNKLAVFSNLDVENLDVSLGRTSNLSVNDVELDTEKLSIPGVYVRQGTIRKLNVQLDVISSSGVKLEGCDIEATVAISPYPPDEQDGDLSTLLTKTTTDFAESIMVKEAKEDLEEEGHNINVEEDNSGYGMGEFSNFVSKLVESAVSQLTVELKNIKLHIIAGETVSLDLLIERLLLSTSSDGERHISVEGSELVYLEKQYDEHDDGIENNNDSDSDSDSTDDYEDEEESELMHSTLFSREEASTMYMSALSTMAQNQPKIIHRPVLDCDSVKLAFRGMSLSGLQVSTSKILGSVENFPEALTPFIRFAENYILTSNKADCGDGDDALSSDDSNIEETESPPFSLDCINIETIQLKMSQYEDSCIDLFLHDLSIKNNSEVLVEVGKVSVLRDSDWDDSVAWFYTDDDEGTGNSRSDFICKIKPDHTVYLLPNPAYVKIKFEDLTQFADLSVNLGILSEELGRLNRNSSDIQQVSDTSHSVSLQTNTFDIHLNTGINQVNVSVLPISLDEDIGLKAGSIKANINQEEFVEITPSSFLTKNLPKTTIRQHDSEEVSTPVDKRLSIDSIKTNLTQKTLLYLYNDFTRLASHFDERRNIKQTNVMNNIEQTARKVRISDEPSSVFFSILIKSIDCTLELNGKFSVFNVDLRGMEANFVTNRIQSTISTVSVTRDFSDIDPEVKHVSLIHTANPHLKDQPVVFFEVLNGKISELRLWNLSLEYHVRLLKLFESEEEDKETRTSTENEKTELEDSVSTIREQELKFPFYLIDCVIGLTPFEIPSKANLIVRDATSEFKQSSNGDISTDLFIRKAALVLIDDVQFLEPVGRDPHPRLGNTAKHYSSLDQVNYFLKQGYVPVSSISSVTFNLNILPESKKEPNLTLELSSELLVLETCADSAQTLVQLINELKPPIEGGQDIKYHTEVLPVDVLENIDDKAFNDPEQISKNPGSEETDTNNVDFVSDDLPSNLDFVESYYADKASRSSWNHSNSSPSISINVPSGQEYSKADLLLDQDLSILAQRSTSGDKYDSTSDSSSRQKFAVFEQRVHSHESMLDFSEDHFSRNHSDIVIESGTSSGRSSHGEQQQQYSNSSSSSSSLSDEDVEKKNDSHKNDSTKTKKPSIVLVPKVKINVNKLKRITWNLHDGYDWSHTQDIISNAVNRVEIRANEAHKQALEKKQLEIQQQRAEEAIASSLSDNQGEKEDQQEAEDDQRPQVIGDLLFNSIYIGLPDGDDPTDLRREINQEINDDSSVATTVTGRGSSRSPPAAPSSPSSRARRFSGTSSNGGGRRSNKDSARKKLKLKRSKFHKVKIELYDFLSEVSVFSDLNDHSKKNRGMVVAGEEGELLNRVGIRIRDFEIIDNVPTSTWNKFVTYMRSYGDRESDASMINITIDNVKPLADIAASEAILNIFVLPLRLHVDQDTLDFLTRFFEFKDDRFLDKDGKEEEILFIQKVDIRAVRVKLDYKPKKVDYRGLKSGHVTEFMNFFILDEAEMVLRRTILYGVPGISRLAQMLHGIWMPDIRSTQLGDVLAGIAPVRSLLRLGSGMKDLVAVPVREYRKDGRIIRSLQKGAWTFARNTTNEVVKFGAKLAAGTQNILESAEQAMGGTGAEGRRHKVVSAYSDDMTDEAYEGESEYEEQDDQEEILVASYYDTQRFNNRLAQEGLLQNEEETSPPANASEGRRHYQPESEKGKNRVVPSLYADQPSGVAQGLQVAYDSLGRNFTLAKQAVSDIGNQTADRGGNAQDAAKAVFKAAPVALIRPVIGATEAVSKTLLGVTNQLQPQQMKDVEDKYKSTKRENEDHR